MIYIAVYAGLLLLGFLSFKDPALRRAIFPVLTGLLFAFVAFRFEVGCDWSGYQANYEAARYLTAHEAAVMQEPGFWLLLTQIHAFNLEYPYLNLIMATPLFWGIVVFARRQPDPLAFLILSFPVLIINMPMSALRQAAAIGFVCLAFVAFHDRKLVRYLVMVAAAALFHTSAIIFLALAPFVRLRLTRVTVAIAVALVLPGMYSIFAESAEFYTDRYIGTGIDAAGGSPGRSTTRA